MTRQLGSVADGTRSGPGLQHMLGASPPSPQPWLMLTGLCALHPKPDGEYFTAQQSADVGQAVVEWVPVVLLKQREAAGVAPRAATASAASRSSPRIARHAKFHLRLPAGCSGIPQR